VGKGLQYWSSSPPPGNLSSVVIVDRGPYGKNRREGAIIDLSRSAAEKLGIIRKGQARVKLDVLTWGNGQYRAIDPMKPTKEADSAPALSRAPSKEGISQKVSTGKSS